MSCFRDGFSLEGVASTGVTRSFRQTVHGLWDVLFSFVENKHEDVKAKERTGSAVGGALRRRSRPGRREGPVYSGRERASERYEE